MRRFAEKRSSSSLSGPIVEQMEQATNRILRIATGSLKAMCRLDGEPKPAHGHFRSRSRHNGVGQESHHALGLGERSRLPLRGGTKPGSHNHSQRQAFSADAASQRMGGYLPGFPAWAAHREWFGIALNSSVLTDHRILVGVISRSLPDQFRHQRAFSGHRETWNDDGLPFPPNHAGMNEQIGCEARHTFIQLRGQCIDNLFRLIASNDHRPVPKQRTSAH